MKELLEYTGPLLAITLTRLAGFLAMQRAAMKLGVESLAAYQLCINCMTFFLLFGEPLSQLCQTQLPALIDAQDGKSILATLKSVLTLAGWTAMGVGVLPFLFLTFGSTIFSSDAAVRLLTKQTAPSIFMAVATAIITVAIDGAMLASRDFGFILCFGMTTCLIQLQLLPHATTLTAIFGTFTLRLGSYALAAVVRAALGRGNLGRIIQSSRQNTRGRKTNNNFEETEI
jgi:Na+-driven multidrug efflux pump